MMKTQIKCINWITGKRLQCILYHKSTVRDYVTSVFGTKMANFLQIMEYFTSNRSIYEQLCNDMA